MNQTQFSLWNPAPLWLRMMSSAAVWGPGLLVMLADTDVGNGVTAAQSGARWGYRLLPILLFLIPLLYAVQELTIRLGIFTGRGLLELAFFLLAWHSHPKFSDIKAHVRDLPLHDRDCLYLIAALIGATFSPWTIFYQQSAVAEKKLGPEHQCSARWDTAIGAMLTQLLTAAILITTAAITMGDASSPRLSPVFLGWLAACQGWVESPEFRRCDAPAHWAFMLA
ncbi:divalent metal cation transporter [Paraburkholderia oxyphila]|uniref:divalent metal cation transporter n=1 Tax=Paraburkholderia oxyphila TaxID=614212 RepID=UPI001FDEB31C|nr:divalent metal cation transporter [Paraburkholderia oxyphila]